MSPLLVVGILVITTSTFGDVKHVLEGSAHPPNPQDINQLSSNQPYWWMSSNSPLKAAYDFYKKCSATNNCLTPNTPPQPFQSSETPTIEINVKNNPFLNGNLVKSNSNYNNENPKIDVKKNPFLSGNVVKSNSNYNDGKPKIDIKKNPFLTGAVVTAGNGAPILKQQDGFIGVQPPQSSKKPGFSTTHPLEKKPEVNQQGLKLLNITVECKGAGFACVEKTLCLNRIINKNGAGLLQVRSDVHYCHEDKEVCCQMNNLNEVSAGKSSVPGSTIKFAGGAGFSPGLIHVQPLDVKPDIAFGDEHGHHSSSTSKSIRDVSLSPNSVFSSTVDYSDTKFDSDVRFASTFQGPAYLPPVGPTSPKPFETRQPNVNQQYVPSRPSTSNYIPPSPTTPRPVQPSYQPSTPRPVQPSYQPSTLRPVQPSYQPSTPRPVQPSYQPSTPRPVQPSYQPSTSRPAPSTSREYLPPRPSSPSPSSTQYVSPPQPYQPSVTPQRPYQPSVTPQQPIVTTQRPYQPSVTTQRPYQPSVTPQRPYQPSVTPQQPYQPSVTPQKPYQPSVTPQKPTPRPYQPSITPQQPYQPSVTPQQPYQPSVTPQKPYQPSVTPQQPYQPSVTPQKPYQPSVTPQNPYQPSVTPQQPYQPSVTPQKPYQPSVTPQKPYQPSVTPQQPYQPSVTPQKPYQPSVTPQQPYQPSVTPQQPYQPTVTPQKPYQPSVTPQQPYQPSVTPQKPYQPSVTPQQPYQPSVTPQKPYQPSVTPQQPYQPSVTPQKPYQPSVTPQQPYQPSTSRPTTSREYLPPRASSPIAPQPSSPKPNPFIPQQTTPRPSYPQPSTPRPSYPQPSTPRPSYPQPSTPRPSYPQPSQPQFRPTPSIPQFPSSTTFGNRYPSPTTPQQPSSSYQPSRPQQPTPAPNPAGGYDYPKPTPTFGLPSTSPRPIFGNSNVNNQYIPPPKKPGDNTDQSVEAANVDGAFVRPTTPRTPFQGELNTAPPTECAAALKCVQEIYCTAEGVISPVPVVLTKEQELSKVPTTECQDVESGIIGKCCRDPNYKDPWPSANLVNGVDDGQYKEDDSIGQYQQDLQRSVRSHQDNQLPQPTCGQRNLQTTPKGSGPLDVNFAEIPWQAMILRDSNRSLLCGGVIIRRNAVLTAAHCVDGIPTNDILIKGGEWKLGIDEEPLPFQVISAAAVIKHPQYQTGSLINDLALLVLEEKLRPSKNVGNLCLPQPNQIPTKNCIATGWGKRILQLHAKGAIMHSVDVKIMDNKQCEETLTEKFQHASGNYSPNTLCGYSDRDQCRVDYGSALACSDGQQYTLSGIFSWDTGCKQSGQIGGYIAPDVEWIEATLAKPLSVLRN